MAEEELQKMKSQNEDEIDDEKDTKMTLMKNNEF
jgi:hypothetical protein